LAVFLSFFFFLVLGGGWWVLGGGVGPGGGGGGGGGVLLEADGAVVGVALEVGEGGDVVEEAAAGALDGRGGLFHGDLEAVAAVAGEADGLGVGAWHGFIIATEWNGGFAGEGGRLVWVGRETASGGRVR
jgi:hypothetical protein